MPTATATFITDSSSSAATSINPIEIHADEAAYLYLTPVPGALKNTCNMPPCMFFPKNKITTPPTVPLEVALAGGLDESFGMNDIADAVSDLEAHEALCIQTIFERHVPFVLAPRVKMDSFGSVYFGEI